MSKIFEEKETQLEKEEKFININEENNMLYGKDNYPEGTLESDIDREPTAELIEEEEEESEDGLSLCCGAEIFNGICSDCKDHAE